jgi:hypothetical protein
MPSISLTRAQRTELGAACLYYAMGSLDLEDLARIALACGIPSEHADTVVVAIMKHHDVRPRRGDYFDSDYDVDDHPDDQ